LNLQISTQRLELDLISGSDASFIHALVNTQGWLANIGDRNIHSNEAALEYINKISAIPGQYLWVARLKEEHTPIGVISFLKRDYLEHFDIGFAFLPAYHGKGYAFEATAAVLKNVAQAGHDPVLAITLPRNSSSIRLLEKLGMHFETALTSQPQYLHMYSNAQKTEPLPYSS